MCEQAVAVWFVLESGKLPVDTGCPPACPGGAGASDHWQMTAELAGEQGLRVLWMQQHTVGWTQE